MDSQQVFLVPQVPSLPPSSSKANHRYQQQQTTTQMVQQQQQLQPQLPQCSICGTTQKLLRCAKCKAIYYCSTDHQHLDWPTHKLKCRALAKQRQINNRLQQLTNGCGAININAHSNSSNSPLNIASNLSSSYSNPVYENIQQANLKSSTFVLGTNENEILNSKAETVTQNSNRSEYMGSFDANSTTTDQMHNIMVQNSVDTSFGLDDSNYLYNDNSYSFYQAMPTPLGEGVLNQTQQNIKEQFQHNSDSDNLSQQNSLQTQSHNMQQQVLLPRQQQTTLQYPVPQLSNHLINQHEKSSSYQIGAAVVDENLFENAK